MSQGRAVGVIRVSEIGKREMERVASPDQQRERIEKEAERNGRAIHEIYPELDVSGGSPLNKRPGLRKAVEDIEAGHADVLIVAYFDRLVRSLRVQEEVVNRVEAAGGRVLAADFGHVTAGTATQWLSSTMLGMVAEYHRRATSERTTAAQERAVAAGRVPFPLMPGYRRSADGRAEVDPATAPIVRRAFEMRAEGVSLRQIHVFLTEHGVKRGSLNSRAMMFRNRMVLGEIHYRGLVGSCPPLIERELWDRVQRACGAPRGRYGKSERLLARTGLLRCESCGGRMSASHSTKNGERYDFYRCAAVACTARAHIFAPRVETLVTTEVKRMAGMMRGRASSSSNAAAARDAAVAAQAALDRAIERIDEAGVGDEPSAMRKIRELRDARDTAVVEEERATRAQTALELLLSRDWDDLSLTARRELVRELIEHVSVARGRRGCRSNVTIATREIVVG